MPGGEGLFGHSLGMLEQRAHAGNLAAHLVFAGAEYGSLDLDHVFIAVQDRVDGDRVAIGDVEGVHVKLTHVVDRVFAAGLAYQAHRAGIGVAGKRAGIFEQGAHALALLHLIVHGALHLAGDVDQTVVGPHHDDVVVGEVDVAGLAVEYVVIDIDMGDEAVGTEYLDVAQRTYVVGAACHVECIEHGGEGRQGVGARHAHLAHHVDHDGLGLSHGETHLRALVAAAQCLAQSGIGLCHGETAHLYGAETFDGHIAVGRYGVLVALLRGTIDVYDNGVARTQTVVAGGGDVHIGLEGELFVVEDVAAEHFLRLPLGHQLPVEGNGVCGQYGRQFALELSRLLVVFYLCAQIVFLLYQRAGLALGLGSLLLLAVGCAHTAVCLFHCLVGHYAHTFILYLAFILVSHAAYLRDVHAALHQLGHYLCLRCAGIVLFYHKLHYLVVGH